VADERVFKKPNVFIPERWTIQKELTIDASVFTPFSAGAYLQTTAYTRKW
jgi:cytochrome P450